MAISRRITCIRQASNKERHERITHIGGYWGVGGSLIKEAEADAIRQIENNIYTYHVRSGNYDVDVIVVTHHNGKKYLRTKPDGTTNDNLLSVPECA